MFADRCTGLATGRRTTPLDGLRRAVLALLLIFCLISVLLEREELFRGMEFS